MLTLIIFLVTLFLIIISLIIKNFEIKIGRKIFFPGLFVKVDKLLVIIINRLKQYWAKVNLQNFQLIFRKIIVTIDTGVRLIKRRFDHKHSPFFIGRDQKSKSRGSVSFFLKDVSDYKKTLRREHGENDIV
jgi:hypothetical protein